MRILVVEDSDSLRGSLRAGLSGEGFAVDVAADGRSGLSLARNNPYDVLVLDLMLPELDGMSVLEGLLDSEARPHVLVLTARDRVEDRVAGLNAGADDYLVKPFMFEELLARIHALVRRRYEERTPEVHVGQLLVNIVARKASYGGQALDLTAREYALLEYLTLRRGQTVSREEIEDHIYGVNKLPSSNAVDSTVCILRAKVGDDGKHLIRTRRGQGYVLEEPRRMKSIRGYLLTRVLGGSALLLAAAGVAAFLVLSGGLRRQFDTNLTDRIQGFASILFQVEDQVEFAFSGELMNEYERKQRPAYFELRFDDGELLERSESLGAADLEIPADVGEEPVHWTAPLPDGRTGRYAAQVLEVHHVYPEEGPDRPLARRVVVALARGREELLAAESTLMLGCAGTFLVLMVLTALLTLRTVARGLAPADRLAAALDAVRVDDLPERLELGPMPSELRPMADTADALVRRVDAALDRERRTTADIAHELRTPISEVLTASEVALRNGRDAEHTREALGTIRDVAWRMARTLSTLLKLARLEMGAESVERAQVDLGALVDEHTRRLAGVARERGIAVENRVAPDSAVECDPEVTAIVVSNLISNALHHAPPAVPVRFDLERDGERWRLVVENGAGDLRAEDLHALAAPFWRKRRNGSGAKGSGLGLALSTALADQTGLSLTFELREGTFRALLGPARVRA